MNQKSTKWCSSSVDFTVGLLFSGIQILKQDVENAKGQHHLAHHWEVIKKWTKNSGNQFTLEEELFIKKGIRAYLSRGMSPAYSLREMFSGYKNLALNENYDFKVDLPPSEVLEIFDLLLGKDEEPKIVSNPYKKNKTGNSGIDVNKETQFVSNTKRLIASKSFRLSISLILVWFFWVLFRTSGDYELLGYDLDSWDDDMIVANLLVAPILILCINFVRKWVQRGN